MGIDRLRERLEELAGEPQGAARELRDQWIEDVRRLYDQVESWLAPLPGVQVHRSEHEEYEEDVGHYKIEHAYIFLDVPAAQVELTPGGVQVVGIRQADGRMVNGLRGRVSLHYGARSFPIARRANTREWLISTPDHPDLRPLDEDAFVDALIALVPELGG